MHNSVKVKVHIPPKMKFQWKLNFVYFPLLESEVGRKATCYVLLDLGVGVWELILLNAEWRSALSLKSFIPFCTPHWHLCTTYSFVYIRVWILKSMPCTVHSSTSWQCKTPCLFIKNVFHLLETWQSRLAIKKIHNILNSTLEKYLDTILVSSSRCFENLTFSRRQVQRA